MTQAMVRGNPSAHKAKDWAEGHFTALQTSAQYQAMRPFDVDWKGSKIQFVSKQENKRKLCK